MKEGSDHRRNVILNLHAKLTLERMAKHYGVTNMAMLERAWLAVQSQLIKEMTGDQPSAYYDGKSAEAAQ